MCNVAVRPPSTTSVAPWMNDAASLAAYNSVRFVYDTARPDVTPIYHAGALMRTTVRRPRMALASSSSAASAGAAEASHTIPSVR